MLFLFLKLKQRLIRSTAAGDRQNPFSADPVHFPNKAEGLEKKHSPDHIGPDLFTRTLSPRSSADGSTQGDGHSNEQHTSGHEGSHDPAEETASDRRKIKPSWGNPSRDGSGTLRPGHEEVLDDNANPAPERGAEQLSCPSSDPLTAGTRDRTHTGRAEDVRREDRACLKRDFPSEQPRGKGSSQGDHGTAENERGEAGVHSGGDENQSPSFPPTSRDQDLTCHSEMSTGQVGAGGREGTVLLYKDATTRDQAGTADSLHPPKRDLSWEDAAVAAPECDLSLPSAGTPGHVCPPGNGVALRNDSLFQTEEGSFGGPGPEERRKDAPRKPRWTFLESQGNARERKTTIPEQIKEPADGEDARAKGGDPRSVKATPTGDVFTCQVSWELSSRADLGAMGAGLIIKTTSENPVQGMSARGKALIAKRPQETARSDRPIEVTGTAFDPHEGRNEQSHYALCQGATGGVICDKVFGKEPCLGICNVHADESEEEEAIARDNAGKTRDRKTRGAGIRTSAGESSQLAADDQHAASKLDGHWGPLPADRNTAPGSSDRGRVREPPAETDPDAAVPSALAADTHGAPHTAGRRAQTSGTSDEDAVAVGSAVTPVTLPSAPSKSEDKCNPASGTQAVEKPPQAGSPPEDASECPRLVTDRRRGTGAGQTAQQGAGSVQKPLGPTILIHEAAEDVEQERPKGEGVVNLGQSSCSAGDRGPDSSTPPPLPAQGRPAQSRGSLLLKSTHSKVPYLLLFLIFLVTIYQYDFMIGLAFYLVSLSWLSWEQGRHKESVKKK